MSLDRTVLKRSERHSKWDCSQNTQAQNALLCYEASGFKQNKTALRLLQKDPLFSYYCRILVFKKKKIKPNPIQAVLKYPTINSGGSMWWHKSLISALRRQRQAGFV